MPFNGIEFTTIRHAFETCKGIRRLDTIVPNCFQDVLEILLFKGFVFNVLLVNAARGISVVGKRKGLKRET